MKKKFICLLFLLNAYAYASPQPCRSANSFTSTCTAHISEIHPGQYAIGQYSIKYKAGKIEKEWAEKELSDHMRDEENPAIYGPNHKLWIIDGHHQHRGLYQANIPKERKISYIDVIADFRGETHKIFKDFMIKNNYVYLKNHQYNAIEFEELPSSIENMQINPYRSLAWVVRKHDIFNKSKIPFAEFMWGEYFKNNGIELPKRFDPVKDISALTKAIDLAKSPQASNLPGFKF